MSDTGIGEIKQFQEQVKMGDLAGVKSLLAQNPALLDEVNEAGQTSFLLASYYRQPEVAEYLLSLDPKLDIFNRCVAGRTSSVLEEADSEPSVLESHSSDGWTPLHLAAFFGHPELAKGLLNRGAAIEARSTNPMKNTPLHAAAAGGRRDAVEVLLDAGADVNARQQGGWTALHAAAQNGDADLARLLLIRGADAALRADNNQSPLDLALLNGKSELAGLLSHSDA